MKPTPETKVQRTISLLREGASVRQVAERLSISKSTVSRIRQKHLPALTNVPAGRSPLLSVAGRRYVTRLITSGTFDTASEVCKHLQQTSDVGASVDTVRRTLKSSGLRSGKKIHKPLLTTRHRRARLEWAKKYKDWKEQEWRRVIWSDETKINLFVSDGKKWCWKRPGKTLEKRVIKQTVKHGGGSIMVWGCMTAEGVGFATWIKRKMDSEIYQGILADELQDTMSWYGLDKNDFIFQQDNYPKHTAKSTQKWLKENEWKVLDWPAQSPDLNPIEHLWQHAKQQLALTANLPKKESDLWAEFESVWNAIDSRTCTNLIDSMPSRVQAVLKARGGHTKY